jgi:two-component system, NarL family, sensor histidine kinase DevS
MTALIDQPGPAHGAPQARARDPGPAPGRAGAADVAGNLGFPDVPRLELELEQLLLQLVDRADDVLAKIRTSVFGLRQPCHAPAGLPGRLVEIIDEHTPQLGFTAVISFGGRLDLSMNAALADDILAVTREALSNCARHAHATAVSIYLALQDGLIRMDITDNGRGPGTAAHASGLTNMRRRAERNGGTFQLTAPDSGGTHLTWTARIGGF